jgi:hypothetical protein
MAEELRAIPDVLCHVGNELANYGESLLAVQRSCLGQAEGVQPGWVGLSAGALSGLLERWATASTAHIGRFGDHACGMHFTAVGLAGVERRNATALAQIRAGGGEPSQRDDVDFG